MVTILLTGGIETKIIKEFAIANSIYVQQLLF